MEEEKKDEGVGSKVGEEEEVVGGRGGRVEERE